MTNLVGREVWHIGTTLEHGTVTDLVFVGDIGIATLLLDDGATPKRAARRLLLTRAEAVANCRDESLYWSMLADRLELAE